MEEKKFVGTSRIATDESVVDEAVYAMASRLRVSMPGIVTKFDHVALTVEVQPAIKGRLLKEDGEVEFVDLPILLDVPVVFPHAGGCSLTFPIKPGDECLVVFSDRCIDAWWANGDVQPPMSMRMHDLSDAFAIPGVWSQHTKIQNVSTACVELRSDDRKAYFSIHPSTHDCVLQTAGNVYETVEKNVTGNIRQNVSFTIGGNLEAKVSGAANVTIEGNLSADVGGSTRLKTNGCTIDSPNTKITGNLSVLGHISGAGGISISGGGSGGAASITGSMKVTGDVTSGGISVQHHTHSGVKGGSSNTGGPQ